MKHLAKNKKGIVGTVVLDVAFDDQVARNEGGWVDGIEEGASMLEVVDFGVSVER